MVSAKEDVKLQPGTERESSLPDPDIQSLIAPAIQRVMAQSGMFARQESPSDPAEEPTAEEYDEAVEYQSSILAEKIAEEFESVIADLQVSFAETQSRLLDMIRDEVRMAIGDAMTHVLRDTITRVESFLGAALAEASATAPAKPAIEAPKADQPAAITHRTAPAKKTKTQAKKPAAKAQVKQAKATISPPEAEEEKAPEAAAYAEQPEPAAQADAPKAPEATATEAPVATETPAQEREIEPAAQTESSVATLEAATEEPAAEAASPSSDITDEDIFEGVVRINVESNQNVRQVVHFVNDISQKPELRLLRLEGANQEDGVEILISLTEPLPLGKILREINGVEKVTLSPEDGATENQRDIIAHLKPATE